MPNTDLRGFFAQLIAGLTGCLFFPFFKKEPSNNIPIWLIPNESLISFKTIKEMQSWGNLVAFWNFDGKGNIIQIINNTGVSLDSKSFSITYRS